jgi:ADP-heptose:LPS heptosyltransferase
LKALAKNKKYSNQSSSLEKVEKNSPIIFFFDVLFFAIRKLIFFKNNSDRVIIISLHRLGDTVFTIPAVKEIFKKYKNAKKVILCYHESKEIYKLVFNEEIKILEKHDLMFGNRIAGSEARKKLRRLSPEIIFDLTGTITSATLIFNSNAKEIIGMNERIFKNIYSSCIGRRKIPHLIDTYLDVAELVSSFERTNDVYQFAVSYGKIEKILIHPFSVHKAKEWNISKFICLAEKLSKNFFVELISPANFLPLDIKEDAVQKGIPISITKTIAELITQIKKCSIFISNDTGPLYIANLLGKPTFTIYGPTNPEFSLPFGEYHNYIQKKIKCSPEPGHQYCFTLAGTYCPAYECMNQLSVEEVYNQMQKFLDKLNPKK